MPKFSIRNLLIAVAVLAFYLGAFGVKRECEIPLSRDVDLPFQPIYIGDAVNVYHVNEDGTIEELVTRQRLLGYWEDEETDHARLRLTAWQQFWINRHSKVVVR